MYYMQQQYLNRELLVKEWVALGAEVKVSSKSGTM